MVNAILLAAGLSALDQLPGVRVCVCVGQVEQLLLVAGQRVHLH